MHSTKNSFITRENLNLPLKIYSREENGASYVESSESLDKVLLKVVEEIEALLQGAFEEYDRVSQIQSSLNKEVYRAWGMLHAFGMFTALAVVQSSICPQYVYDWLKTDQPDLRHNPFFLGLDYLDVPTVSFEIYQRNHLMPCFNFKY